MQQRAPRFVLAIVLAARAALFDHRNAGARRQFPHRGRKIDVLVIHDEAENASADAAAEAVKRLPLRTDRERRRLLLMKRAERLEIRARALERKIRADHLHDVVRGGDLLDVCVGIVPMAYSLFARLQRERDGKLTQRKLEPAYRNRFDEIVFRLLLLLASLRQARPQAREIDSTRATSSSSRCAAKFRRRSSCFSGARRKAAENAGAAAIIFEMNTYGGRLDTRGGNHRHSQSRHHPDLHLHQHQRRIGRRAHRARHANTFTWRRSARSARPLRFSRPAKIFRRPRATKPISYWSALIRGSATRNGHNPDIGEAFMNKEKEVKIGDRVVHPKGSLLTLNAQEATEKINGKPVLAEGIADSVAGPDAQRRDLKGNVGHARSERL